MARSRNIKPSLFKNEVLGVEDPLLTILFEGLWCLADRDGKLEDRPMRIKAEIFPYRELPDFNGYLTDLERLGFITRYQVGETAIIVVLAFKKHQSPHKTEKASELPDKPLEVDITVKAPLNNQTVTEEAALIPDSFNLIPYVKGSTKKFTPPDQSEVADYFKSRGCSDTGQPERFCDFYESKNWMVGKNKMKSWEASARNWIARSKADNPTDKQSRPTLVTANEID